MATRSRTKKHSDHGLDALDPRPSGARDATYFRKIIAARKRQLEADQALEDAVRDAREAGDSWTVIGAALDVSRQAAQQRFGQK